MNLVKASHFYKPVMELHSRFPKQLPEAIREYIDCVEDEILNQPQQTIPIDEHLADGLYVRTMHCPAGTMLTGAWHRKPGLVLLQSGDISVLTAESCTRAQGTVMFPCPTGARRLGYCHTDVVWTNIFSVDSDNVEDVYDELFAYSYEDL